MRRLNNRTAHATVQRAGISRQSSSDRGYLNALTRRMKSISARLFNNGTTLATAQPTTSRYSSEYFDALTPRMLHADRIFYNRVPKCGSSAMMGVIGKLLGSANGVPFQFRHSRIYHTERLPTIRAGAQEVKLLDNRNGTPRIIYERHLYFLNFEIYNRTNPLYINMVRKPVQRSCLNTTSIGSSTESRCHRKFEIGRSMTVCSITTPSVRREQRSSSFHSSAVRSLCAQNHPALPWRKPSITWISSMVLLD